MDSAIAKNILQTIIYYDILSYPLTSFEVWQHLTVASGNANEKDKCSLGEIIEALDNRDIKRHVEEFRGFYFLKGKKDLVERRIQNGKNSIVKYKIAERVSKWLRFVPFVRMVAVTGTLAMKNSEKNSDIDFLVILEKGRIFTGRLLVTLVVHLLGKRRYGNKIKNRICLNYFITLGSLAIKKQDIFAANEYSFIYPLFDSATMEESRAINKSRLREDPSTEFILSETEGLGMTKKGVFCQFGEENIEWIKKLKPNFEYGDLKPAKYFIRGETSNGLQRAFEGLINLLWGDRIESWLKRKQIEKIKKNPLTYKKGGYVEYNDDNLVFLPEPQGPKIIEQFKILTTKNNLL